MKAALGWDGRESVLVPDIGAITTKVFQVLQTHTGIHV